MIQSKGVTDAKKDGMISQGGIVYWASSSYKLWAMKYA